MKSKDIILQNGSKEAIELACPDVKLNEYGFTEEQEKYITRNENGCMTGVKIDGINKLREILESNTAGGTFNIIWGPEGTVKDES